MRFDNLTICYQGIQRVYRNAVVQFVRERLTKEFGENAETELKKPFQKEWAEIEAAAREYRNTGELDSPLKDSFDVIGVNHFQSIFDRLFEKLCPSKAATTPDERKSAKQALLGWMKVVKNFRDPLSHPAEIDFSVEDARIMMYNARKVLDFLHLPIAAKQLVELSREFDSDFSSNVSIVYLPPSDEVVTDFVGRQGEVQRLQNWLDDPYSLRWALSGDGGKGKSAIAYSFARITALRGHPSIEAVIWLSAKVRRFIAGRTITVDRPDFTDLESALDAILRAYGWSAPATTDGKRKEVLALLKEIPALLIIDDIDTIEKRGSDAIPFLLMDIPAKTTSRALVTSRRILFGLESCTTPISGFQEQDARVFVESRCRLFSLNSGDIFKYSASIMEVTDGSPLYIEDLLRLVTVGVPITQAIGIWKKKRGDAAREYSIRREFDQLSNDAQQVLLALSLFDGPCTMDQLRSALEWSIDRIIDAQQSLRQLYLMPSITGEADSQKLALNVNTSLLVQSVFKSDEQFKRLKRAVDAAAGRLAPSMVEEQTVASTIRQVITKVNRAFGEKSILEDCLKTLNELNEKYPSRADISGLLGWVLKRMEKPTDAREAFRRSYELGIKNQHTFSHWSTLEADAHEWSEAARVAEIGCKTFPRSFELHQQLGYCLSRAGQDAIKAGDEKRGIAMCRKADAILNKAATLLDKDQFRSGPQRFRRALVLNAHSMKDGKLVRKYLLDWRVHDPSNPTFGSDYDRLRECYPELIEHRDRLPVLEQKP